ncbi:MAG TPA: GNAT family N-acetyltransferase [Fimbriimonadaceae bacterium]|nr:GNAT family N-acetyltransferase [Fimbriimonadaceae bacterium]
MENKVVRLEGGLGIVIRPIRRDGVARLAEGIRKLSPQSRQMRFFSTRELYSEAELRHVVEADGIEALTLVAATLDEAGEEAESIAAAHFFRNGPGSDCAEVAIAVLDAYHRLGVGTTLLSELALEAKAVGIRRWSGICSTDNVAIMRLIAKVGKVELLRCASATYHFELRLF